MGQKQESYFFLTQHWILVKQSACEFLLKKAPNSKWIIWFICIHRSKIVKESQITNKWSLLKPKAECGSPNNDMIVKPGWLMITLHKVNSMWSLDRCHLTPIIPLKCFIKRRTTLKRLVYSTLYIVGQTK